MRKLPTLLLAVASCASAQTVFPEKWVDAIEQIESGGRNVTGDKGLAKGYFQFHRGTWIDVSKLRREQGLKTYNYSFAGDKIISREYAITWLNYLHKELTKRIGREPFVNELWMAYNMGLAGFAKINYQVCNATEKKYRTCMSLLLLTNKIK